MGRLTKWWDSTNGMCGASILNGVDEQTALTKLAALEDILCSIDGDEITLDELREMVQAKREGRCVIFPCKVGDIIWHITCEDDEYDIEGDVFVASNDKYAICTASRYGYKNAEICETLMEEQAEYGDEIDCCIIPLDEIYFSRPEAKAALAAKEGEKQ